MGNICSSPQETSEEFVTEISLQEQLDEAGLTEVRKAPGNSNTLDPGYLLKLLNFVTTIARKRREDERQTAIIERRECFKNGQWDKYQDIVQFQFLEEDMMCQKVMRETLELLPETNEHQFQVTMAVMAQNPAFAQMIVAAQQGMLFDESKIEEAKPKRHLERSLTLRAFEVSKRLTMQAMQR